MKQTQSSLRELLEIPFLIALTIALFEFIASFPPLSITEFPDFKQRTVASHVTFGRDS